MLFRDALGNIVELNKHNFVSDIEYYKKLYSIIGVKITPKKYDTKTKILSLIKK
jgi:hypothetical protein